MCGKGVDGYVRGGDLDYAIFFKNSNVTDEDLAAFIPAFNGALRSNIRIIGLELNGSPVSDTAIRRFEQAVPGCYVKR